MDHRTSLNLSTDIFEKAALMLSSSEAGFTETGLSICLLENKIWCMLNLFEVTLLMFSSTRSED